MDFSAFIITGASSSILRAYGRTSCYNPPWHASENVPVFDTQIGRPAPTVRDIALLIKSPWTPIADSPLQPLPGRPAHPYYTQEYDHQLRMVRPSTDPVLAPTPPHGYEIRQYGPADEREYQDLFHLGFETEDALTVTLSKVLDNGFFVVEHSASRTIVASCVAERGGWEPGRPRGILGWLIVDPSHSGLGLGTIVTAMSTNLLCQQGYNDPGLSTDDFRLAAIKIYLNLGWQPYLHRENMEPRWLETYERLGLQFRVEDCVGP